MFTLRLKLYCGSESEKEQFVFHSPLHSHAY